MQVKISSVLVLATIVGAAAFAAGRASVSSTSPAGSTVTETRGSFGGANGTPSGHGGVDMESMVPDDHPGHGDMPPNHPSGATTQAPTGGGEPRTSELGWKPPARWQSVPNASTMRLATYRVPRAPGDDQDAEVSVTQAGGALDANIERWMGQFGEAGKTTTKRTTKRFGSVDVTLVEMEGTYSGGMGADTSEKPGWALSAAIVDTPGLPHFFKMTGPKKTVKAAQAELEGMMATLTLR